MRRLWAGDRQCAGELLRSGFAISWHNGSDSRSGVMTFIRACFCWRQNGGPTAPRLLDHVDGYTNDHLLAKDLTITGDDEPDWRARRPLGD